MSAHILSQLQGMNRHLADMSTEIRADIRDLKQDVRSVQRTAQSNQVRITKLEQPKQGPKMWTPRDYVLASAGLSLVMAAIFEKVPWSTVSSFVSAIK